MPVSISLATAVAVQLLCQLFKVVDRSVRERRLQAHAFVSAGGMPSAHTALVASLSLSIGLNQGFDSDLFAVVAVFSVIVIYDILRLRAAVQRHTDILTRLVAERAGALPPEGSPLRLPPSVGHTPAEVLVGACAGAASAVAARLLFGQ